MELNIHLYVHLPESDGEKTALAQLNSKLDTVIQKLVDISKFEKDEAIKMDQDVQAIIAQAKANENIEQSAVQAINDLAAKLLAAINAVPSLSADDRAALQAQVTEMQTNASALGSAIATGDPQTVTPPAGDGTGTGTTSSTS